MTVERGLALVVLGGLSLDGFVRKACSVPARMLGLDRKGHLGIGADGDAVLVDPERRRVRATFAGGRPIMVDGIVIGSGGTVVTTEAGRAAVAAAGLPVRVIDVRASALYRPTVLDA